MKKLISLAHTNGHQLQRLEDCKQPEHACCRQQSWKSGSSKSKLSKIAAKNVELFSIDCLGFMHHQCRGYQRVGSSFKFSWYGISTFNYQCFLCRHIHCHEPKEYPRSLGGRAKLLVRLKARAVIIKITNLKLLFIRIYGAERGKDTRTSRNK